MYRPWRIGCSAVCLVVTVGLLLTGCREVVAYDWKGSTKENKSVCTSTTWNAAALKERPPLRYKDNGRQFSISDAVVRSLTPECGSFITLAPDKMADFVFVTAASADHFTESVDAIASVQSVMPTKRILYFDLGLTKKQIAKVKTWCSVTYQYFDLHDIPDYGTDLYSYAWKAFVIEKALRNHSAIFWIDSSFRLTKADLTGAYQRALNNGGIVMFIRTDHSNYVATFSDMFRYLVTDVEAQKKIEQLGTGALLIYRTEKVFREVLWWFYLCSLERSCILPTAHRFCKLDPNDRYATHAQCHRFDQSIVNLLLSNLWLKDGKPYTAKEDFFVIRRYVTHMYTVNVCNKTNT